MTDTEAIAQLLNAIVSTEPKPWYPGDYVRAKGVSRDAVDEPLNRLRVAGLVRMTDWEAGKGQGYYLTSEGQRALRNPKRLADPAPQSSSIEQVPRLRAASDESTVTRLLIAAQIGMFAVGFAQAMELGTPANQYLAYGTAPVVQSFAVSTQALLVRDAWWTLLSYALVHGGLMHLGCNLFGHFYDASLLERLMGSVRFSAVYLISVLFGGIGAVLASPKANIVGSSGGLCGVFAAQFVWFTLQRHLFDHAQWSSLLRHYLRVCLLVAVISLIPGVSWGGHLGGAVGGSLTCLLISLTNRNNTWLRRLGWLGVVLLPLLAIGGEWWWLHR